MSDIPKNPTKTNKSSFVFESDRIGVGCLSLFFDDGHQVCWLKVMWTPPRQRVSGGVEGSLGDFFVGLSGTTVVNRSV